MLTLFLWSFSVMLQAVGNYASVAPVASSAKRQARLSAALGLAALAAVAIAWVAIATKSSASDKPVRNPVMQTHHAPPRRPFSCALRHAGS